MQSPGLSLSEIPVQKMSGEILKKDKAPKDKSRYSSAPAVSIAAIRGSLGATQLSSHFTGLEMAVSYAFEHSDVFYAAVPDAQATGAVGQALRATKGFFGASSPQSARLLTADPTLEDADLLRGAASAGHRVAAVLPASSRGFVQRVIGEEESGGRVVVHVSAEKAAKGSLASEEDDEAAASAAVAAWGRGGEVVVVCSDGGAESARVAQAAHGTRASTVVHVVGSSAWSSCGVGGGVGGVGGGGEVLWDVSEALLGAGSGAVEYIGPRGAETVIVVPACSSALLAGAVSAIGEAHRVGVLSVRLLAPFPEEAILSGLPATARSLLVPCGEGEESQRLSRRLAEVAKGALTARVVPVPASVGSPRSAARILGLACGLRPDAVWAAAVEAAGRKVRKMTVLADATEGLAASLRGLESDTANAARAAIEAAAQAATRVWRTSAKTAIATASIRTILTQSGAVLVASIAARDDGDARLAKFAALESAVLSSHITLLATSDSDAALNSIDLGLLAAPKAAVVSTNPTLSPAIAQSLALSGVAHLTVVAPNHTTSNLPLSTLSIPSSKSDSSSSSHLAAPTELGLAPPRVLPDAASGLPVLALHASTRLALADTIVRSPLVAASAVEAEHKLGPRPPPAPVRPSAKAPRHAALPLLFPHAYDTRTGPRPSDEAFVVTVRRNVRLTPKSYSRNIFHLELDTAGTPAETYEVGAALGLWGHNDPDAVRDFARVYGLDLDALVTLPPSEALSEAPAFPIPDHAAETTTVGRALSQLVDLFGRPSKRFCEALGAYASDPDERTQLFFLSCPEGAAAFRALTQDECITHADLLERFPSARPPLNDLLAILPPLKPRHYSIASSAKMHPGQVHLLIVLVDWTDSLGRYRTGQCTRHLVNLQPGERITACLKPSDMKLPQDPKTPVVMAGLGTGMAPFRAFVEERAHLKRSGVPVGPMLLYFGARHRDSEYLYGDELEAYVKEGVLTATRLAFSRDGPHKVYIQHLIKQDAVTLASLFLGEDFGTVDGSSSGSSTVDIEAKDDEELDIRSKPPTDGLIHAHFRPQNEDEQWPPGHMYLCGPTWPEQPVQEAIENAFVVSGGLSPAEANETVVHMKEHGRYILEVY